MSRGRVTALVGAQFGSEGKGLIAEKLAADYAVCVRTGAPNAGHTYYIDQKVDITPMGSPQRETMTERVKVVARSVPCGVCNPNAQLVIGPGGLIDMDLLLEEVRQLNALGLHISGRLSIDSKVGLIHPHKHHQYEGGVYGEAHSAIGSTGEGVGPARMAKISRGTMPNPKPTWSTIEFAATYKHEFSRFGIDVIDTARMVNDSIDMGLPVMLEGTQGSALSLVHGYWPYVTSSDTNAGQLAVDAGIAPQLVTDVLLVARTFPIRVAGNSGPLPHETDWDTVGQPEERTTVTKKVRRVGMWDAATVRRAVMLNRPSQFALTFVDYWFPEAAGAALPLDLPNECIGSLAQVEAEIGVPLTMIGTGPDSVVRFPLDGQDLFKAAKQEWPSPRKAYGA